jgi:hypothetical protein
MTFSIELLALFLASGFAGGLFMRYLVGLFGIRRGVIIFLAVAAFGLCLAVGALTYA